MKDIDRLSRKIVRLESKLGVSSEFVHQLKSQLLKVVAKNEPVKLQIPKNLPPGSEKYFQDLFDEIQKSDDGLVVEPLSRRRRLPKT